MLKLVIYKPKLKNLKILKLHLYKDFVPTSPGACLQPLPLEKQTGVPEVTLLHSVGFLNSLRPPHPSAVKSRRPVTSPAQQPDSLQ